VVGVTASAAFVLAVATDLHYMRLLGFFAVLATVLAAFFSRAIACWMCAFIFSVLWHKASLLSVFA
jgi:hypothetical protein